MEKIFSYGTLQSESIQQQLFGRKLEGHPEKISEYKLDTITIKDDTVVATSDITYYPIAIYTGNQADVVSGIVFFITEQELMQADEYEGDEYRRVLVTAESEEKVWVYVRH